MNVQTAVKKCKASYTGRKLRPGHYAPQICYFCPNGDFGTDYTYPTKAIAEIESAYRWNAQREVTPWD